MAQDIQCSALVELISEAGEQCFAGLVPVILDENFPGLWLRGPHPCEDILRKDSACAIIARRIALGMEPAVGAEVLANLGLEVNFFVQTHSSWGARFQNQIGRPFRACWELTRRTQGVALGWFEVAPLALMKGQRPDSCQPRATPWVSSPL